MEQQQKKTLRQNISPPLLTCSGNRKPEYQKSLNTNTKWENSNHGTQQKNASKI